MDADDEDILVVRAIEDGDAAAPRGVRVNPPQEVVVALFRGRLLESLDIDTLGIHGADHVPARSVLAGAVDPLQDDEKTMAAVRVKFALQDADAAEIAVKLGLGVLGGTPFAVK